MQVLFGSLLAFGTLFLLAFGCVFAGFIALEIVNPLPAMLITIGISALFFAFGPWITDFILRLQYRILWLTDDEFRKLDPAGHALLHKLCKTYSITMPKMGVIPDRNPTAFT